MRQPGARDGVQEEEGKHPPTVRICVVRIGSEIWDKDPRPYRCPALEIWPTKNVLQKVRWTA